MSQAVVTGGLGFIGSHLVDTLIEEGWEVTVLDDQTTGELQRLNPKSTLVNASVTDAKAMKLHLADAEYVFHLAALPRIQPSFEDPVAHDRVNVGGTLNCLEAVKGNRKLKKFVFSASSACYGTPVELPTTETASISCLSPYALQKYAAEQYCMMLGERFDIPVVSLRYFNVYGPRSFNPKNPFNAYSSVLGVFHNQRKAGEELTVTGDGTQSRDFVHVHDVARANRTAALSERRGSIYNVGTGAAVTIRDLAELFGGPMRFVPGRQGEAHATNADITKIRDELGWVPEIDLKTGLELLDE